MKPWVKGTAIGAVGYLLVVIAYEIFRYTPGGAPYALMMLLAPVIYPVAFLCGWEGDGILPALCQHSLLEQCVVFALAILIGGLVGGLLGFAATQRSPPAHTILPGHLTPEDKHHDREEKR
jgi:hypothetical protein